MLPKKTNLIERRSNTKASKTEIALASCLVERSRGHPVIAISPAGPEASTTFTPVAVSKIKLEKCSLTAILF